MTDLSLAVGDRVVYPNQGLCTVTDIKTEEIAGQRLTFVSLVFTETGAKVKVPQDKLAKNGVRRVSSVDDVKKIFDFLKSDSERASLDWKKRARDNTARLSEGGLAGLAEVVKGLQVLSELRPLPPKERGQYNDARHLLVEEVAAALGISEADAEDSLDILLFPPGKERPKRSIEEFQGLDEDDELGLGDELLGLDGEPADAGEVDSGEGEGEDEAGDAEGEEKKKPSKAPKGKPEAKPAKSEAKAKGKKSVVSDVEVTEPLAAALPEVPQPRKRGRPPRPKPPEALAAAPPKKRGRPPLPKPPEAAQAPRAKGRAKGKK
jgi:RNA polymerase-interacting CarD/CdnL/TRCF family regulator